MRAKTSDFKSIFPISVLRKTVLTDVDHSHGLEDDKLSKISPRGTNHNPFLMIFAGIAFLKKWTQSEAPNEYIVQNHWNIALLNIF